MIYDTVIVGGGIVGLAAADALAKARPQARIAVIEKEASWAAHQTGRNSGVIHSGIYYKPGSLKAALAIRGNRTMADFCRAEGIPFEICGKLIVATSPEEQPRLRQLHERAQAHGLSAAWLEADDIRAIEPHAAGVSAIRIPSTGITQYARVAERLAQRIQEKGGALLLKTRLDQIRPAGSGYVLETTRGPVETRFLVNCGGLHSDRIARLDKADVQASIIPFRGEYFTLKPGKRHLVNHLIYPVPDPDLPFLGVHLTRMIDGSIHAGPNAVLSLKREGYRKTDFSWRDAGEMAFSKSFWKLARRYGDVALQEWARSVWKPAFVRSLQRLVPAIQSDDLEPSPAGVRAQAVRETGRLLDDFYFVRGAHSLHVCNAPSPAATASLEIGRWIVDEIAK